MEGKQKASFGKTERHVTDTSLFGTSKCGGSCMIPSARYSSSLPFELTHSDFVINKHSIGTVRCPHCTG